MAWYRDSFTFTHWIGGWVGPRTGLDGVEKTKISSLPGLELRPLGRAARSQLLYRLSYLGCIFCAIGTGMS
jgi:hypothetical protein